MAEGEGDEPPGSASDGSTHQLDATIRRMVGELRTRGTEVDEKDLKEVVLPAFGEVVELTEMTYSQHSGPLPSAAAMKGYAELYPDGPKQLFKQLKDEQQHRHDWEMTALNGQLDERSRRDYSMIAVVAIGLLIAGYIATLPGGQWPAVLLVVCLVLGGGALQYGRMFLASHGKDGTRVEVGDQTKDQPPVKTES